VLPRKMRRALRTEEGSIVRQRFEAGQAHGGAFIASQFFLQSEINETRRSLSTQFTITVSFPLQTMLDLCVPDPDSNNRANKASDLT